MRRGKNPRPGRSHPGAGRYPARGPQPPDVETAYLSDDATQNPHLTPLGPTPSPADQNDTGPIETPGKRRTGITRRAARRGKDLTNKGIDTIARAATADGADRSGLTALTIPVVANAAVDAAMAVALANTLFFAAASGEDKAGVGLYLLLTIAPFAIIAPLIGPALDRLQHGRRMAMATTFIVRAVLAILIVTNYEWDGSQLKYDPWILYPCALGMLVMGKSFGVLKSAVTPRVLPPSIDLVRVNSRLTTFGLIGGTMVGGAIAAGLEMFLGKLLPFHLPGAMLWLVIVAGYGAYKCMQIPSWVEVTAGEIPTTLTYRDRPKAEITTRERARRAGRVISETIRQPLGRRVVTGLWGNGTIRILTGFLTLFTAFFAREHYQGDAFMQMAMLGSVGAAAGIGNVLGNAVGTRLKLANPSAIIAWVVVTVTVAATVTAILPSLPTAAITAFLASAGSAVGKVCLDSAIQSDLPEPSRASAFGRSETVLQLGWVFGASIGVLIASTSMRIAFGTIAGLLLIGLIQTFLTSRGSTLVPGFGGGGHRPDVAPPTVATEVIPRPASATEVIPRPASATEVIPRPGDPDADTRVIPRVDDTTVLRRPGTDAATESIPRQGARPQSRRPRTPQPPGPTDAPTRAHPTRATPDRRRPRRTE
ncbi:MAG: MFS transporter [Gordonia sp. (in: high G+C Gram-positive bacteria)]|uniref:MFS transporter n=1 Tax=Gordonia sp. (in: high G+C Gram-positive bacteria) TaxID=84139 RepID=UPI0039E21BD3